MRKVVLGLTMILWAFAAIGATTPEITPPSSGDDWVKLNSTEKLFWALGYSQGYLEALNKIDIASGPGTACASLAARTEKASSTAGKVSGFELVNGLEKFFAEPANMIVPVSSAVRIYLLQASGKDQTTLQELIETARLLGAESRRLAQK